MWEISMWEGLRMSMRRHPEPGGQCVVQAAAAAVASSAHWIWGRLEILDPRTSEVRKSTGTPSVTRRTGACRVSAGVGLGFKNGLESVLMVSTMLLMVFEWVSRRDLISTGKPYLASEPIERHHGEILKAPPLCGNSEFWEFVIYWNSHLDMMAAEAVGWICSAQKRKIIDCCVICLHITLTCSCPPRIRIKPRKTLMCSHRDICFETMDPGTHLTSEWSHIHILSI